MSYSRFSSDDFNCDVYIYQSDEGYVVHVAETRTIDLVPSTAHLRPTVDKLTDPDAWLRYHAVLRENSKIRETAPRQTINGPSAGKTFIEASLDSLLGRVIALRTEGIRVPEFVFDAIIAETMTKEENRTDDWA